MDTIRTVFKDNIHVRTASDNRRSPPWDQLCIRLEQIVEIA
jgi:hypothetical protein